MALQGSRVQRRFAEVHAKLETLERGAGPSTVPALLPQPWPVQLSGKNLNLGRPKGHWQPHLTAPGSPHPGGTLPQKMVPQLGMLLPFPSKRDRARPRGPRVWCPRGPGATGPEPHVLGCLPEPGAACCCFFRPFTSVTKLGSIAVTGISLSCVLLPLSLRK